MKESIRIRVANEEEDSSFSKEWNYRPSTCFNERPPGCPLCGSKFGIDLHKSWPFVMPC